MSFCRSLLLLFLLASTLRGSEFGVVVAKLADARIENAKLALGELEKMIAEGDARTVTLGKKIHRSVKRIFTKELKMIEGKKEADDRDAKAKQLDLNGRNWLKPNVHGRINKIGAAAAFRDARELRLKSSWSRTEHSKEWREEVLDFEKMLGDLQFSKEDAALLSLAEMLAVIVKRTPWVERPPLIYDEGRIRFLRERAAGKDRWMTLAEHAADASDFELAYNFYRLAGSELGRFRVGAKLAGLLTDEGYPGSAMNLWERLGEADRAAELSKAHPEMTAVSYQVMDPAHLERNVAPACVRVLIPGGHQTGFFFRQGGLLLTSKEGLRDKDGNPYALTVVLEDGRKFPAKYLGASDRHDLAALGIDHAGHELLPLGHRVDLKPGLSLSLFGFPEKERNVPSLTKGTVLAPLEEWNQQPTSRLAMDGSRGMRGAPVVDQRGRVLGMYLSSRTGSARTLEAGAIRDFVKQL